MAERAIPTPGTGRRRKRRHDANPVLAFLIYAIVRLVAFVLGRAPDRIAYPFLRCVGRWVYRLHFPLRARVRSNLRIAFGDTLDAAAIDRIGSRATENFAQLFADVLGIARRVTRDNHHRWFEYVGFECLEGLSPNTGIVFLTGHVGSFEAAGHAWGLSGYPLNSVSRPMKNRFLYRWMTEMRRRTGQEFIPRKGALRQVLRLLKDGRHVAFLFDQNQRKEHVFVPFFGRLAATTPAPAVFALRMGAPIVFGFARRLDGRFRFRAECRAVIEPPTEGTWDERVAETMRRANAVLEEVVREHPEEYFWFHHRWRTRPPEEVEGSATDP